jgi:hypothetical protein
MFFIREHISLVWKCSTAAFDYLNGSMSMPPKGLHGETKPHQDKRKVGRSLVQFPALEDVSSP